MAKKTTRGTTTRGARVSVGKKPRKPAATAARKSPVVTTVRASAINPDLRRQMIAEAAYLRAERRGFSSGDPKDDWLAAEREIDRLLAKSLQPTAH